MTPELEQRKAELTRMGYTVRHEEPGLFVASFARWYWDCFFTKLSFIVLVRRVQHLTADMIQADFSSLGMHATQYDPSALPRGFQKGRALIAFYLVDSADPAAIQIAQGAPKLDFASFTMAGILDGQGNQAWYDKTAIWGAVFYAKLHHVMRRLMQPTAPPVNEPLSKPGVGMMGCLLLLCLTPCVCVGASLLH